MKTSLTKSIALCCTIFFLNFSFANNYNANSAVCLKINGLILKSAKEERGSYKVKLLKENLIIDSTSVSVNKPFEFKLEKNSSYKLCVTKNGFVPFLISIDTRLPQNNSTLYEFLFETELLTALSSNTLINMNDVPATRILKFDEINDRFYPIVSNEVSPEARLAGSKPTVESKPASLTCLKINGLILKSPKGGKGTYKVELFLDNDIVETKNVAVNKPFEFTLNKNLWYTVRITKEDFITMLISVDTEFKKEAGVPYEFNFQTELYHKTTVNSIDRDSFDLPIGLIRFDESKNRFYPIEDYRAHVAGSF
jgi:hypothetical protein